MDMTWVLLSIVILLVAVVYAAWICFRLVFYNRNVGDHDPYAVPPGEQYEKVADEMLALIHKLDQLPYEQVYITARDGTRMAARYYEFHPGGPVQIQMHGYRGNSLREYAGGFQMAQNYGYNALVTDERAHGLSGGHIITFGIRERYDCLDWVNYVNSRFGGVPIILSGVSMGAATVLMASELDLPENVKCITADCPYSSPGAIIKKVCRDMKLPAFLAYPLVALGALLFGGFRIWECSAVAAVRHSKVPIHIIHGDDDRFVPCEMSREILAAANCTKRLITVPGAGHGLSYLMDPAAYEEAFGRFLRESGIPMKE